MNVVDRLAIQDLYSRISVALDTADEKTWVSAFAEDAELSARELVRGRPELADFFRRRISARPSDPTINTQHWTSNLVLTGEPPDVRGFCYLMKIGQPRDGGPVTILTIAAYQDHLRKVDGEWLIVRRRVVHDMPLHDQLWEGAEQ